MFYRFQNAILFAALVAFFCKCTSHSVPIPPPSPEQVYFSMDMEKGEARFRYTSSPSYSRAVVYIFNRDLGEGVITSAEANGSVMMTSPFPAMTGDEVVVSFEVDGSLYSTCIRIREGQSSSTQKC